MNRQEKTQELAKWVGIFNDYALPSGIMEWLPDEEGRLAVRRLYQDYFFYQDLEALKKDNPDLYNEIIEDLGFRLKGNKDYFKKDPVEYTPKYEGEKNHGAGVVKVLNLMRQDYNKYNKLSDDEKSGKTPFLKDKYKTMTAALVAYQRIDMDDAAEPNAVKRLKKVRDELRQAIRVASCAGQPHPDHKGYKQELDSFCVRYGKLPEYIKQQGLDLSDTDLAFWSNDKLWNEYLTLSRMAPGEEEGSTVRGDQIEEEKKKIQEKRENAEKRLEELRAQNDGTRTKDDPIFAEMKRLEAEIQQCEASVKVLDREAEGLAQEVTNAGDKGSIKTRRAACKAEIEARLEIPEFREFVNKRMAENAAAGNQEFLTNNAFSAVDDAAKNNQRVYEFLLFENDFSLGQRDWYKKPTLKRDKENPYIVPSSYKGADVAPVTKEEPPKPDKTETPPERPTTQTIVDPKGPQQARTDASVEEEKRKDLEAIIQTDQRSWLMRNWEWLVAVLLLIAATAFGVFQHKRSKKKEKAAKSEKAAVEASNTELSGRLDEVNAEINSLKTLAAGSDGEGKPNDSGSAATGGFFTYGDLVDTNRTNSSSTDRTQLLIAQTNRNNNK